MALSRDPWCVAIDVADVVDAIGLEHETGDVILSIIDATDWSDVHDHLTALQAKLNGYFAFVETDQLADAYPDSVGREVVIDVITKHPMHAQGEALLAQAAEVARALGVRVRTRCIPAE